MRAVCVILAVALSACGGAPAAPPQTPTEGSRRVPPVEVSDGDLPSAVLRLAIESERAPERTALLHGLILHRLGVAKRYFADGHREAGYEAVLSGLYFARSGEFDNHMVAGGEAALSEASELAAQNGWEGASRAFYSMLRDVLPPGKPRDDVVEHLQALDTWKRATRSADTLQARGDAQRVLTERSLLQPTPENVSAAEEATIEWIDLAIQYSREQLPPQSSFERDEAIEAYRAVRTGPLALTALHLRHGNAGAALDAVASEKLSRVAFPNLQEALSRARDGEADAWYELFRTFDSFIDEAASEAPVGRELARAASWGSALELYRLEPSTMRGAMPLSTWLARHWMSEAAIPILTPIAVSTEDPRVLSWVHNFVLQAIVAADSVGDVTAARRVFEAASPVLEHAEKSKHAARVSPSPTRLRYVMGAIESRSGHLSRARELLVQTTLKEPSIAALRLLSAIDRQRGDHVEALKALERVSELATRAGDVTTVAETRVSMFEIHRDLGATEAAKAALAEALRRALDARQLARTGAEQAAAERVLARVLEYYGEDDGARRAIDRAYEAARSDVRQVAATLLEASRRALTDGDLDAAREATRRAIEAGLPDEDIVYVALWQKLVELGAGAPSDGTVEEAFAATDTEEGWASSLRDWGSGRIDDEALLGAARSLVERTEAMFYSAMASRGRGNESEALERLTRVARSEAIQLVEVTIARDLVARSTQPLKLSVPDDVEIP